MRYLIAALLLCLAGCQSAEMDARFVEDEAAADDEIIYCSALKTETTAAQCRLIGRQIADLQDGIGELEAPEEMTRGDTAPVRFSIAPTSASPPSAAGSQSGASAPAAEGEEPQMAEIPVKIGRSMSAELTGSGFAIAPQGEQLRDLGAGSRAAWSWDLTALEAGERTLYLTVKAKAIDRDGRPTDLDLYEARRSVNVGVTTGQRLNDLGNILRDLFKTWEGALVALAALIGAITSIVWAVRKLIAALRGRGSASPASPKDVQE